MSRNPIEYDELSNEELQESLVALTNSINYRWNENLPLRDHVLAILCIMSVVISRLPSPADEPQIDVSTPKNFQAAMRREPVFVFQDGDRVTFTLTGTIQDPHPNMGYTVLIAADELLPPFFAIPRKFLKPL